MSQFNSVSIRKKNAYRSISIGSVLIFFMICLEIFAQNATAAINSASALKTKTHRNNPVYLLKSNLSDLTQSQHITLDWKHQSKDISFDLPSHDWYEKLNLFISAVPQGRVSARTPLLISFNGSDPIPLFSKGRKFDAHIKLNPDLVRTKNNVLKFTYQTPSDVNCLAPSHGQWQVDLKNSKLVANVRARQEEMTIAQFSNRLAHPMTSPKRVKLLAFGEFKTAFEALSAQAMAQRTKDLPYFLLKSGISDVDVIIGKYEKIRSLVRNKSMLKGDRARLFVDTTAKPRLVITGPDDITILALTRAFAQRKLPQIPRSDLNVFDLQSAPALMSNAVLRQGFHTLSQINMPELLPSWHPIATQTNFAVSGSHRSTGELFLKLSTTDMPKDSKIDVLLNNNSIGYTVLDKVQKRVSFSFGEGQLYPSNNVLSIRPSIDNTNKTTPTQLSDTCNLGLNKAARLRDSAPAISIDHRSYIAIQNIEKTPLTDLSHIASEGGPFNGMLGETTIVLDNKTGREKLETYRFLGFVARQIGPKWTQAHYVQTLPDLKTTDHNILFIGSQLKPQTQLIQVIPDGLKQAMLGQAFRGENKRVSRHQRQASTDKNSMGKIALSKTKSVLRVNRGGVAALFTSAYQPGKMIGVISSSTPEAFGSAIRQLATPSHWNALQGSVSRWNDQALLVSQVALPLPNSFLPKKKSKSPLQFAEKNIKQIGEKFDHFMMAQNFPKFKMPKLSLPLKRTKALANPTPHDVYVPNQQKVQNPIERQAVDHKAVLQPQLLPQQALQLPDLSGTATYNGGQITPKKAAQLQAFLEKASISNLRPSLGQTYNTRSTSATLKRQNWSFTHFQYKAKEKWQLTRLFMRNWRVEARPFAMSVRSGFLDLLHNRLVVLGVLALIMFLLMGFVSPKFHSGQKR